MIGAQVGVGEVHFQSYSPEQTKHGGSPTKKGKIMQCVMDRFFSIFLVQKGIAPRELEPIETIIFICVHACGICICTILTCTFLFRSGHSTFKMSCNSCNSWWLIEDRGRILITLGGYLKINIGWGLPNVWDSGFPGQLLEATKRFPG